MMSAQSCRLSSTVDATPRYLEKLLTGALFTLALGLTVAMPAHASDLTQPNQTSTTVISHAGATQPNWLADGIYLYGRSPKAEQIGSAYMLINVSHQRVVGAFYMPASSFDCFKGEVRGEQLALSVVDSYEQTAYPYSVALQTSTTAASGNSAAEVAVPVGYHRIEAVSDHDRKILATCQANR